MDPNQIELAKALNEGSEQKSSWNNVRNGLRDVFLYWKGISFDDASAATLVFEGSRAEVQLQKLEISKLVQAAGGLWGSKASGKAGYTLTFAIAYLRDFGLDHRILSESLETMVPWSCINQLWPQVQLAVEESVIGIHRPRNSSSKARTRPLRLDSRPFRPAVVIVRGAPSRAPAAWQALHVVPHDASLR